MTEDERAMRLVEAASRLVDPQIVTGDAVAFRREVIAIATALSQCVVYFGGGAPQGSGSLVTDVNGELSEAPEDDGPCVVV